MDVTELAEHFPNLWHVTFAGGWEGIQRQGLLRGGDGVGQAILLQNEPRLGSNFLVCVVMAINM